MEVGRQLNSGLVASHFQDRLIEVNAIKKESMSRGIGEPRRGAMSKSL